MPYQFDPEFDPKPKTNDDAVALHLRRETRERLTRLKHDYGKFHHKRYTNLDLFMCDIIDEINNLFNRPDIDAIVHAHLQRLGLVPDKPKPVEAVLSFQGEE